MSSLSSAHENDAFYSRFQLIINIASFILVIIYSYLKFSGIPVDKFINPIVGDYLIRLSIIFYFAAFVYGASFDLKFHRKIMHKMDLTFQATPFMYLLSLIHILILIMQFFFCKFAAESIPFFKGRVIGFLGPQGL